MKTSDQKKKYLEYINSDQWASVRADMIEMHGYICQFCGKQTKTLQLHHLTYDNLFCENPSDLVLLCGICHMDIHSIKHYKAKHSKTTLPYARKIIIKNFDLRKSGNRGWIGLAKTLANCLNKKYPINKKTSKKFVKDYIRSLTV